MPRWLMFLLFFGVAVLILGSVHYYFYRRLFVAPVLPPPWPKVGAVALAVATLSFPASFAVARSVDVGSARFVLYPIYIWLGVMMLLFFMLLSIDLARGIDTCTQGPAFVRSFGQEVEIGLAVAEAEVE